MAQKATGLRPPWEKRDDSYTEKLARANLRDNSPARLPAKLVKALSRRKGATK